MDHRDRIQGMIGESLILLNQFFDQFSGLLSNSSDKDIANDLMGGRADTLISV